MNRDQVEYAIAEKAVKATIIGCNAADKALTAVGKAVETRAGKIAVGGLYALGIVGTAVVYAAGENKGGDTSGADAILQQIESAMQTWLPKIGAMIIGFGGLKLALAIKDSDEGERTNGMKTIAAGAIVSSIGAVIKFTGGTGGATS